MAVMSKNREGYPQSNATSEIMSYESEGECFVNRTSGGENSDDKIRGVQKTDQGHRQGRVNAF